MAADVWNSLSSHTHNFTRLDAARQRQLVFALQRWDFNLRAEGRLTERDGNLADEIHAVALKEPMRLDANETEQVAAWSAVVAGLPFAGKADAVACVHAG